MAFVKTISPIDEAPADPASFMFTSSEVDRFVICKSPGKLQRLLADVVSGRTIHFISDGDWSSPAQTMMLDILRKSEAKSITEWQK